jgi:hypothetical protein
MTTITTTSILSDHLTAGVELRMSNGTTATVTRVTRSSKVLVVDLTSNGRPECVFFDYGVQLPVPPFTSECDHGSVDHDEIQLDVDVFKPMPSGVCEDCGDRVRVWSDTDPDGTTWGYETIEGSN